MALTESELKQYFPINGTLLSIIPYGNGHIHKTFLSTWSNGDSFIHQIFNTKIFQNIDLVMNSILEVTHKIKAKSAIKPLIPEESTFEVIKCLNGKSYAETGDGLVRTFTFIPNTESIDVCDSEERAYEAGRLCGALSMRLSECNPKDFPETIKGFLDISKSFRSLHEAIESADEERLQRFYPYQDRVFTLEKEAMKIFKMLENKELPLRVSHNDMKLNNLLFSKLTKAGVAVVDLDTLMPGSPLHDFGGLVRLGASTAPEDEEDLSKVSAHEGYFKGMLEGFLSVATFLNTVEQKMLRLAPFYMTIRDSARFFADYLSDDIYFGAKKEHHNLFRGRAQLKLAEEYRILGVRE